MKKRFPLTISRGTFVIFENLFVFLSRKNNIGIGEMCPGLTEGSETAEDGKAQIEKFLNETGANFVPVIENC